MKTPAEILALINERSPINPTAGELCGCNFRTEELAQIRETLANAAKLDELAQQLTGALRESEVKRTAAELKADELLDVARLASFSIHHDTCGVHRANACSCHVKAARTALEKHDK